MPKKQSLVSTTIPLVPIISGFMQNSKRFPDHSWLENSFLSTAQLSHCRTLLLGDDSAGMALAVIALQDLSADLSREGRSMDTAFLDSIEQTRLRAFPFAKRQREWLGGRIAAKRAAMDLWPANLSGQSAYHALRVENDPTGRPYLVRQGQPNVSASSELHHRASLPEISITHSGGVAAALAVDSYPCGIDVQRITAKAITIRERFALPAEQAILKAAASLRDTGEAEALTLLWSAKESLRKAIACQPLLGFSEVVLRQLEGSSPGEMVARCTSPRLPSGEGLPPVFLALSAGYACAITINRACRHQ